jgi:hypothetical protein
LFDRAAGFLLPRPADFRRRRAQKLSRPGVAPHMATHSAVSRPPLTASSTAADCDDRGPEERPQFVACVVVGWCPDPQALNAGVRGPVKDGRRETNTTRDLASRPLLDWPENDGTLAFVEEPSAPPGRASQFRFRHAPTARGKRYWELTKVVPQLASTGHHRFSATCSSGNFSSKIAAILPWIC